MTVSVAIINELCAIDVISCSSCSTHECDHANEKNGVDNEDGDDDKNILESPREIVGLF